MKQIEVENYYSIERVRGAYFDPVESDLEHMLDYATFIGRASEHVYKFLREWAEPALTNAEYHGVLFKADKAN